MRRERAGGERERERWRPSLFLRSLFSSRTGVRKRASPPPLTSLFSNLYVALSTMARFLISLAALAFFSPVSAWTPEVQTQANLGGSITALSVENSVIRGKTSVGLPISSFDACVRACADFRNGKGCNTVVWCGNSDGCGSGCSQQALGPFPELSCTADGRFPSNVGERERERERESGGGRARRGEGWPTAAFTPPPAAGALTACFESVTWDKAAASCPGGRSNEPKRVRRVRPKRARIH